MDADWLTREAEERKRLCDISRQMKRRIASRLRQQALSKNPPLNPSTAVVLRSRNPEKEQNEEPSPQPNFDYQQP